MLISALFAASAFGNLSEDCVGSFPAWRDDDSQCELMGNRRIKMRYFEITKNSLFGGAQCTHEDQEPEEGVECVEPVDVEMSVNERMVPITEDGAYDFSQLQQSIAGELGLDVSAVSIKAHSQPNPVQTRRLTETADVMPRCQMHKGTVHAMCADFSVKEWGIGAEGEEQAAENCNYMARIEGKWGNCHNLLPKCRKYKGSVYAMCGRVPKSEWGFGPEGVEKAIGNCNYMAMIQHKFGSCPPKKLIITVTINVFASEVAEDLEKLESPSFNVATGCTFVEFKPQHGTLICATCKWVDYQGQPKESTNQKKGKIIVTHYINAQKQGVGGDGDALKHKCYHALGKCKCACQSWDEEFGHIGSLNPGATTDPSNYPRNPIGQWSQDTCSVANDCPTQQCQSASTLTGTKATSCKFHNKVLRLNQCLAGDKPDESCTVECPATVSEEVIQKWTGFNDGTARGCEQTRTRLQEKGGGDCVWTSTRKAVDKNTFESFDVSFALKGNGGLDKRGRMVDHARVYIRTCSSNSNCGSWVLAKKHNGNTRRNRFQAFNVNVDHSQILRTGDKEVQAQVKLHNDGQGRWNREMHELDNLKITASCD